MSDSVSTDSSTAPAEEPSPPTFSATTNEAPSFGWSSYAERINGRFAMVGLLILVALELCTGSTVMHWLSAG